MTLYKTTIIVWSRYDPSAWELSDLAHDATDGEAYCSKQYSEAIVDPTLDWEWDGNEFFVEAFYEDDEQPQSEPHSAA